MLEGQKYLALIKQPEQDPGSLFFTQEVREQVQPLDVLGSLLHAHRRLCQQLSSCLLEFIAGHFFVCLLRILPVLSYKCGRS